MKRPVPWLAGVSLLTSFSSFSCSHMEGLWPYAIQSAHGDRASCEQFNAIFDRFISQPEYCRYDAANPATFVSVGHWVPQFMWMGILLEQGLI